MKNTVEWVSQHKAVVFLLAVVVFLLLNSTSGMMGLSVMSPSYGQLGSPEAMSFRSSSVSDSFMNYDSAGSMGKVAMSESAIMPPSLPGESVDLSQPNRMVVRNASFSLLVKNVKESIAQIEQHAVSVGGIMVNSSANSPTEGGSGQISIRVPGAKLNETLAFLRGTGVRVVSENIDGNDVTDQYTDTEARLATLNKSKATFESMMDRATTVDEILRVQQSILQVQDQIDSLKGQLDYLKKTSESSLISVYLSTDELALPYSPSEPWRPQVVFKTAVRSLMMTLRSVANLAIWGVVYLPILAVVGLIGWLVYKKFNKPKLF